MPAGGKRRSIESRKAVVYAVLVHLTLIALVVVGLRWQASPDTPLPIQARIVNEADVRKEVEQRKRSEREPKPAEPKKKREVEEKPRPEQAKLNEQKRREDDKRKAFEAEKKRKDEARQAEAKKKKDAEERRKAAETSLREQLAHEEQERARAAARAERDARAQQELTRVEGLIKQKIERNWVRPAGWTQGMECVVRVRLIPTGEAVQATVVQSSGNPAFDRSVENAVYKASPLPLPEDKSLFEHFRELELRFRPEGKG